jgi:hypothetical protein
MGEEVESHKMIGGPEHERKHPMDEQIESTKEVVENGFKDCTQTTSVISIDYTYQLRNGLKFAFTYSDDDDSLGSSVCSGLRNSLHSSYEFHDLEKSWGSGVSLGDVSFGDQEELISWREPPEISESDWTLTVESVPSGVIDKYPVHKSILTRGYKHGDFFVSLFGVQDNNAETIVDKPIKVHEDAARLIPEMLDFLYSLDDELAINSESAACLAHLAQFFGMKALAKKVLFFMYDDMNVENIFVYLDTAMAFDDMQTLQLCADKCAECIEQIAPKSSLLPELDPSFVLNIVSSKRLNRKKHSRHLSKLIAIYCINSRCDLNGSVFEELTCGEYLPCIDEEAALPLLMLESKLIEESAENSIGLTSLQKRCVKALLPAINGSSNGEMRPAERKSRQRALNRVPKKVLVDLLSRSLR